MATITQDMRYRLSLIKYAEKFGVTKLAVKYKTNRQYIYRWKRRYDGSVESLRDRSRRPHHHPNQHTPGRDQTHQRPAQAQSRCRSGRFLGQTHAARIFPLPFPVYTGFCAGRA